MKRLFVLGGMLLVLAAPGHAELICGKDLDGDTFFDGDDEITECISEICPHDATDCSVGQPSCGDGALLDTDRDTCQMTSAGECPANFTFDPDLDKCLAGPLCPAGSSFSAAADMCVKTPLAKCDSPYVLDVSGTTCVAPGECAAGTLDAALGRCELEPTWSCPAGMTLAPGNVCQSPPACPPPGVYSALTDRCETPPKHDCPAGYAWNGAFCEASANCGGGVLNTGTDQCEVPPDKCPAGTAWSAALDQCVVSATCADPEATLNPVTDRCEIAAMAACPQGTTWTGSACEAAPVCAHGTFDPLTGLCVANPEPVCLEPGYALSPTTGRCESPPICTGGSYQPGSDVCAAPSSCAAPYVTSVDGCTAPPVCPEGYVYEATIDRCVQGGTSYAATATWSLCSGVLTFGNYTYQVSSPINKGNVGPLSPTGYGAGVYFNSICQVRLMLAPDGKYYGSTFPPFTITSHPAGALGPNSVIPTGATGRIPSGVPYADWLFMKNTSVPSGYTCPNGGTLIGSMCVFGASSPACPSGGTFDGTADVCRLSGGCAHGAFNSALSLCTWPSACSGTGVLDPVTDSCALPAQFTCPDGMTSPDPAQQDCSAPPACPEGSTWDGTSCLATPSCPTGTSFNQATGSCVATDAPQYVCPSGYGYSAGAGRCEKAPVCAAGTFDPSSDLCVAPYTEPCSTPGYTYVNGRCEKTPECSEGFSYNPAIDKCVRPEITSPPTFTTCRVDVSRTNGYFMNWGTGQTSPATDACVANAGQTCTINESTGYELTVYTYYFNSACDITRVFLDYQAFGIHPDEDMVPTPGYPIRPGQTATSSTKFVYGAVISHTNSSSPGCPPGSVLNAAGSCVTQTYAQAPPDCANLDFVKDVCFLAAAASCPAGLSYSSTLGLCAQAPDCAGGALDTGASVCAQEATVACPSGTGWTGSLCAVSATCPTGTSLGGDGVCRANPSCPDGTTLSGGTCVSPPPCPPGTVSPPANICVAAPECPAGTTLSSGTCLGQSTPHCPAGYQLDGTVCHQPPQCAVGSYTAFADTCFAGSNPCPVGYAINKVTDVCGKSPTCPQGGSYNLDTDLCRAEPAYTCAAPGYSYDPGTGACWTLAVCNQSTLNPLTDSCEVKATPNCGMRAYDPAEKVCHEPVNCRNGGVYSLANSQCELTPGMDCGDWILNPATRLCEEPPLCPGTPGFPLAGSLVFDASLDKCSVDAMHDDCLPDYTYQPQPVGMCEKPVTCSQGEYDPVTDTCPGVWNCPLGGQFACADIGTGTPQCSPVACTDPALDTTPEEEADTSALINDGTVDEAGNCDGLWMIFNGKGQECLPSGWSTSFFDCCKTGSDSFLFIEKTCSKQAYEVAVAREAGRTHYVGTYCKKKIKLIGCVQRARVFCVFNSKMGRIIQEGCRPQLADFGPDGGWGTAKAPNCVGLTPEQFQSCDFGKIDFAEMQGDFAPNLNNVAPSIQGAIDGYMQNIR